MNNLISKLINEGGILVAIDYCTAQEIIEAEAAQTIYPLPDGNRLLWLPRKDNEASNGLFQD